MTGTHLVRVFPDTYVDSVVQLAASRAMRDVPGVAWAAAAMATPANVDTLTGEGFPPADLDGRDPDDLVVAVVADDEEVAARAADAGAQALFRTRGAGGADAPAGAPAPRTLREALAVAPDGNLAVVSVPGEYAALETHKALTAGLDVLLFSDNVSLDDEVALKQRAVEEGRLVMGPGAGTALLGGTCLGFANVTRPGPVAVVAAAGTGAQEVMSLLDRWGVGVSHVVGLGGRDLSDAVDGRMARLALRSLDHDDATALVLLVSKPPSARVAREVLTASAKPVVASLVGLEEPFDTRPGVELADTLEGGVRAALARLGHEPPAADEGLPDAIARALEGLSPDRTLVRGLFSGGTLCYEALVVLSRALGPVHSNTPLDPDWALPAPHRHVCLDLGEEEYTRGRPHPMIDPEARLDLLREAGRDPEVAVVLLDVVLGYGAHPDPAAALAPVCAEVTADGGPRVVAYVLGTEGDPQGYAAQREAFARAGCVVPDTSTRAALAAAALVRREPRLAQEIT